MITNFDVQKGDSLEQKQCDNGSNNSNERKDHSNNCEHFQW